MSNRRLTRLDSLMLAAESPTQPVEVVAVLISEPDAQSLDFPFVVQRATERFAAVEPMRTRLQTSPLGAAASWVDTTPDIYQHLHHCVIGPNASMDDLGELVGAIASKPLPSDQPPFGAWFVEGLEKERRALVVKVHHASLDGISGFTALASLFDFEAEPGPWLGPRDFVPEATPSPAELAIEAARELPDRMRSIRKSGATLALAAAAAWKHRDTVPMPGLAPRLSFNRALTARRSVSLAHVPIDEVKRIKAASGATVNDVMVALVTGGLRNYLAKRNELPDRSLVAAVPVSEREGEHGLVGNRLGIMLYSLPTHLDDAAERLAFVQQSARDAKTAYEEMGPGVLDSVADLVPQPLVSTAIRAMSALGLANVTPPVANISLSNIRGPDFPLWAAGVKMTDLFPFGPVIEGVGMSVTVASYCDRIDIGFLTCPDLVPELGDLVDGVMNELDALARIT